LGHIGLLLTTTLLKAFYFECQFISLKVLHGVWRGSQYNQSNEIKTKRMLQSNNPIEKYSGMRWKSNSSLYFCHKTAAQGEENGKKCR
jgi:hypothetical protein